MVPVHRKIKREISKKKTPGPGAGKRAGRGPRPGTLHRRVSVDPENVAFVKDCVLSRYKKARGWGFLKPEERKTVTSIADTLIRNHIVTSTMKSVVINALIELDFQGVIGLPPPGGRGPKKK